MPDMESAARRVALQAALIVVAGIVFYLAQTAIDRSRATLAVQTYFDCLQKAGSYDYAGHGISNPPSAGEVCDELASYRK